MQTSAPMVTDSATAMVEPHSVSRTDREPHIQRPDLEVGNIEEAKDISTLPCGDDWPTLLRDFGSTNTLEAQDQLSLEQGLTDPTLVYDFATDVCILKISRMKHHCEHPGCNRSFATRHKLL
jgi:hypothetical protein